MNISKKAVMLFAGIMISTTLYSTTAYAAIYTIVPNDSLYKVSQLFKTPLNTVISDNNLKTDKLYPGETLYLPAEIYTIKSGDSMFLIAQRNGIPLASLRQANNKWNDLIYPGQQLILPGVTPTSEFKAVISYTPEEIDLLARLIQAEAGGETYSAMLGVGGVVVNRVQSPDWPSNISSVINHVIGGYYQFTPVKNGYINNPATDLAKRAAWDALYGIDLSNNATFYFDDSSTNQWMWSKTITAHIDSMVFVK